MNDTTAVARTPAAAERGKEGAGYRPLTLDSVGPFLEGLAPVRARLGDSSADWSAREVGDGNINFVYIVEGPAGSVCVKQALPYVRLVGESWPLPLSRSFFEHAALVRQARLSPGIVPEIYHFDEAMALIVMENLGRHVIWRKALIARERHDEAAPRLGRFMAETLFGTSDLALAADVKKDEVALFSGNTELCKITEDLVFTDPYREHEQNRWTSPELDDVVAAVRADEAWKIAIQDLKHRFLTRGEAMLHGDLHTGSVMVAGKGDDEDIRVIDAEFAFYGPMGFDVGALIANLFLNYFAQAGLPGPEDERQAHRGWLLEQVVRTWSAFEERFTELWRTARGGAAYPPSLYEAQGQPEAAELACRSYLARLQTDALGFAGAKMARRILGLAHVEDLESIEPPAARADCERRALRMARALVVEADAIGDFDAACERAETIAKAAQ